MLLLPRVILCVASLTCLSPLLRAQEPAVKPRRVVLIVCDGMRPDFITDANMPTLAKLGREGVFFARHHPVYPSSTEVNGAALSTGCYPQTSGIIANREFREVINPRKIIGTEKPKVVRKGDAAADGRYLASPTLPELVQAAGDPTAVAGTKSVALFWDRSLERSTPASEQSSVLFGGNTLPAERFQKLTEALGPFQPDARYPNRYGDHWTTRALTQQFWKNGVPRLSILWLSDPDFTQHKKGVGSRAALRALRSCDDNIATVLTALDAAGERANTDLFVVSDHGFSTINRKVDFSQVLQAAGFPVVRKYRTISKPGDLLIDSLGGTVFFYVAQHDAATTDRLVKFLQASDFAGVIFTRDGVPGTFSFETAKINTPNSPDVAVAMRWSDAPNASGAPGLLVTEGDPKLGRGSHTSLSRYDMHNTLIGSGPDLRHGFVDDLPSSNADVAPTLAFLLKLTPTPSMDGRVLHEALTGASPIAAASHEVLTAETPTATGRWRQTLHLSHCAGVTYFDEGNASPP